MQNTSKNEHDFTDQLDSHILAVLDATPLCVNLWTHQTVNIMCNHHAVELFELENKQEYLDKFFSLSPQYQPDGRVSADAAFSYIEEARRKGYVRFNWLHCKLNGEEIPAEITLTKLKIKDGDGNPYIAGFTRDLRPQLAGNESGSTSINYFLNHVSDKTLFSTVAKLSNEWFFTLDLRTSLIRYFGMGAKEYMLDDRLELFPDRMLERGMVYSEDEESFKKNCKGMKNGESDPFDVRFVSKDGSARHYRIIFDTITDMSGRPIIIIGKASDINEQKNLEIMSQTDLLTNCYNKVTSENLITQVITTQHDKSHALFIVDIDNFKAVNDNLGHHFGDLVLSEISDKLRVSFRDEDIIGRIGGDEFIVFLKNISDPLLVEEKAELIATAFKNNYSGDNKDYKISGSIGIALYPENGATFDELYKAADKALYQSKLKGKDCITVYSDELVGGTMKNRTILENASRMAGSYFDSELISEVFSILGDEKADESAVDEVLKFVCQRIKADRCYIFETNDRGKTYSNTYEWCKDGVESAMDKLQNLSYKLMVFSRSERSGVFYCNDIMQLDSDEATELMRSQNIKAFLQVQTIHNGYIRYVLGLDDCVDKRVWNEKDVNSMLYVLKLISIFLKEKTID